MSAGLFTIPAFCALLGMPMLFAGDLFSYRGIRLGANLSEAARQADTSPAEARTVHQRPAVIQELEWQPLQRLTAEQATQSAVQIAYHSIYAIPESARAREEGHRK